MNNEELEKRLETLEVRITSLIVNQAQLSLVLANIYNDNDTIVVTLTKISETLEKLLKRDDGDNWKY